MAAIGQLPHRAIIQSISLGLPCVVTTVEPHDFPSFSFVRLTNLNGLIPVPHGADQLNNNRYRIIVTGASSFYLQNPITFKDIDSTNFPPYTEGGHVNLIEDTFYFYGEPGEEDA